MANLIYKTLLHYLLDKITLFKGFQKIDTKTGHHQNDSTVFYFKIAKLSKGWYVVKQLADYCSKNSKRLPKTVRAHDPNPLYDLLLS